MGIRPRRGIWETSQLKAETGWSSKQENNDSRDSLIETKRAETFLKRRSDSKVKCYRKFSCHKSFQFPTELEPTREGLLHEGRVGSQTECMNKLQTSFEMLK